MQTNNSKKHHCVPIAMQWCSYGKLIVMVNTATRHGQKYQNYPQIKSQTKPLGGTARSVTEIDLTMSVKIEAQ